MYTAGQFLEVREGVTVRLNKDTAEIANAVLADFVDGAAETLGGFTIKKRMGEWEVWVDGSFEESAITPTEAIFAAKNEAR